MPKPLDAVGVLLPRGRNQMTNPGKSTADSLVIIDFCTHTSKNCESSHDLKSFETTAGSTRLSSPSMVLVTTEMCFTTKLMSCKLTDTMQFVGMQCNTGNR